MTKILLTQQWDELHMHYKPDHTIIVLLCYLTTAIINIGNVNFFPIALYHSLYVQLFGAINMINNINLDRPIMVGFFR